jgi:hypothetical protein
LLRGRRRTRLGIAAFAALVALLGPGVASAQSQTITPTRFDDTVGSTCQPTDCSLRAALDTAMSSPGVTVSLLPGTYEVTLGQLVLYGDVVVNGAGARATTIDANNTSRVFFKPESNSTTVINDVTITGGNADVPNTPQQFLGGGIYVTNNSGLSLNRSAVVGNRADDQGGGIFSESGNLVQIVDSTISANVVGLGGEGGGIASADFTDLRLFNTTVSGNQAGIRSAGGGVYALGDLEMAHVTIAGNTSTGAGLHISSGSSLPPSLVIWNSIVASNSGDECSISGRTNSGGNNLADDGTCLFTVGDPLLGLLQDNGGPTNTQALSAGSPAIGGADAAHCRATDQRGVARPQQGTCDLGAFEYVPPPPPGGQQQPPPPTQELPPPRAGKSVNALPKSGTVRVKLPGQKRFRELSEAEQLPVGTTFDARKGHVTLVAAADKKGKTSTAEFWAGIFKLTQTKSAKPITNLELVEKLSCAKAKKATIAAKRKKKRRLWGDGSGKFRTEGEFSSATVRGTKWLVEDRCASTLTRVVRGRVAVRDFVKKKTVVVRAGKRYVARSRK